ncbi:MAG: hypothetical protein JWM56_946 [Candidatus Peribacteria bacterium]|nr:hypothetical protein [Candidatus Peribacteria bacterium]
MILQLIFLRHGETAYTHVFPDLTEIGKQTVVQSAHLITKILDPTTHISFRSSPAARAQGSASILASELGYTEEIYIVPEIAPLAFVNREAGMNLLQEYVQKGGRKAVDKAYDTDDCFEDAAIFEPRTIVKKRFFGYIQTLILEALKGDQFEQTIIHVSHFECLHHLANRFLDLSSNYRTLENGELIILDVVKKSSDNGEIILTFRNEQKVYVSLEDFLLIVS